MTRERRHATDEPTLAARTAVLVCAALLVLTGVSIALAYLGLGGWSALANLLIAAVQAVLIGAFYMRIRYTSGLPRLVVVAALLWFAILLVGTLDDVLTRGWLPVPGK
jgi:cytochrome c oxidase subunit IV